jgi:penicillin-binding protein 1A
MKFLKIGFRHLKKAILCSVASGAFLCVLLHVFIEYKKPEYKKQIIRAEERNKNLNKIPLTRYVSESGTLIQSSARNSFHEPDSKTIAEYPKKFIEIELLSEDRWYDSNFFGNDAPAVLLLKSVIRAILTRGGGGGSGINNQVARTLVPLSEGKSFPEKIVRKIEEFAVIEALKEHYGKQNGGNYKDPILNIYLNQVFLGTNVYGFKDGARVYFHNRLEDLSLAQQATLIVMLSQPNSYLCISDPEKRERRYKHLKKLRDRLLDKAAEEKFISRSALSKAKREPIALFTDRCEALERSPYFTDYAARRVKRITDNVNSVADAKKEGHLSVRTTLNLPLQRQAESILAETVRQYGKYGIDLGAIVVVQTSTGKVLTMAGENDDLNSRQFNHIVDAQRLPASTFKLFTYLAALESSKSFDLEYLAKGIAYSDNDVAKMVSLQVGRSRVINMARRLGINSKLDPNAGTILGQDSASTSLLELVEAYRVVANGGVKTALRTIDYLFDSTTCRDPQRVSRCNVLYRPRIARSQQLISPLVATQMTKLLTGVVERPNATGGLARIPGVTIAGKTGTNGESNNARDLWFIGYSPKHDLTIGVWLATSEGNKIRSEDLKSAIGGHLAARVWKDTLQAAIGINRSGK